MTPESNQKLWHIPTVTVQLADGSTLVKPGKAVLRAGPAATEKITGISPKQLRELAEEGYIRRGNPTRGKVYYYPAEVTSLAEYIEGNPDFWTNPLTRKNYLQTRHPKPPQKYIKKI